jgi:hypothetical protein
MANDYGKFCWPICPHQNYKQSKKALFCNRKFNPKRKTEIKLVIDTNKKKVKRCEACLKSIT